LHLKDHEIAVVALEATDGLELMVIAGLSAAGLPVVALNPKNVRGYATALGLHAKTDQIDAHVIARFAADVKPEIRPLPDAETQTLSEFMSRRRQLVQMIAAEKNRALRSGASKALQRSISRVIEALERELARLDGDIDKLVKASPVWLEKEKLLSSVPGVGKIIARTLLAEMPELSRPNRRQIAALTDLAPASRRFWTWRQPQFCDQSQDAGEELPRDSNLGHLLGNITAVAADLGADQDQLLLEAGQSPILDRLRCCQGAQEVAEIVGERHWR
jgi:transposase